MMLSRWQSTIVDAQGNVQPGAVLTIRNEPDQSLAQVYMSPSTTQPYPLGQVPADSSGFAYFYAPAGLYRIQSQDLSIDWRHVALGSAATRDVGTGPNEVPANSNLGAAAYLPIATTSQAQELTNDAAVITPKKLADAFLGANQSLGGNGYQMLPGGLIIQWGNVNNISPNTEVSAPLPIAFPNAGLRVVVSHDYPPNTDYPAAAVRFLGTSEIEIGIRISGGHRYSIFYIAIGY